MSKNAAVRLIFRAGSTDHITPLRKDLHWLPIGKRLDFKISLNIMTADLIVNRGE